MNIKYRFSINQNNYGGNKNMLHLRTKIILFTLILLINLPAYSKKIGTINEIRKPQMIYANGGFLYIADMTSVFVYSLKDMSFIREMGRKGEGPGEMLPARFKPHTISASNDKIVYEGARKLIFFSKTGKLIKEVRKNLTAFNFISQNIKATDKFVSFSLNRVKNKDIIGAIKLYDGQFKLIKELCTQTYPDQRNRTDMFPDAINFWVYKDKIYVEQSKKGFYIQVYNNLGKKLYAIQKDYEKIKVSKDHKKDYLKFVREDLISSKVQDVDGFFKKVSFNAPEFFPAIREILVVDDKIFVKTFKTSHRKDLFIIMDLKGNILSRQFLPGGLAVRWDDEIDGRLNRFFSISNNRYYYLVENYEEEVFEVFYEDILLKK